MRLLTSGLKALGRSLAKPRTGALTVGGAGGGDDPTSEFRVVLNLPVKHAYKNEVCSVVEGIRKTSASWNSAGRQNLKSNPGLFHTRHVIDHRLWIFAPGVIVSTHRSGLV